MNAARLSVVRFFAIRFLLLFFSSFLLSDILQGENLSRTAGSLKEPSLRSDKPENVRKSDTLMLFRFEESDPKRAALAGLLVSIDRREGDIYTAYANRAEMQAFREAGFRVEEWLSLERLRPKAAQMAGTVGEMAGWDRYPSYPVYVQMMRDFASRYPGICRLDTIGFSVENRLILCLKISDSVNVQEPEPGFFYSSSIHGDELTGFVLMLRLADYLLSRYGKDREVTDLVDSIQIYINPLANPDGAYFLSDEDISGAMRYNANYCDLNRNYPDYWNGSPETEKENQAMISYMENMEMTLSVNLHGGSDVLNFPWDAFVSERKKHADYAWWVDVCRRFVDTCRKTDASAYRDVCSEGYIHGGDWYVVSNGRQDYVNVYRHSREMTLEISADKCPESSRLPRFWDINHRSLINHIKEAAYGIRGKVSDSLTGRPLRARITIENHDCDSSQVYSSAVHGAYFRPVREGTYTLRFEAPGYRSRQVENVRSYDFCRTVCNVALLRDSLPGGDTLPDFPDLPDIDTLQTADMTAAGYQASPNPVASSLHVSSARAFRIQAVYDAAGRRRGPVYPAGKEAKTEAELDFSAFPSGWYIVRIEDRQGRISNLKVIRK